MTLITYLLIKWLISNPCYRQFKWTSEPSYLPYLLCAVHQPKPSQTQTNATIYLSKNREATCSHLGQRSPNHTNSRSFMLASTGRPPLFSTPQIINPYTIHCERAGPIVNSLVDCEFAFLQDVSSLYIATWGLSLFWSVGPMHQQLMARTRPVGLPFSVGQTL